ncbi:hypothetical protein V8F20_008888 [Naviculisporaceae sp. PSN 640]
MSCGKPIFDVPKPIGPGAPKPINNPSARDNPVHRRATYHNPTLRTISYKAQNPSSLTFRDFVILLFSLYALYRGFFTARDIYTWVFVHPVGRICPGGVSLGGCVWDSLWNIFVGFIGYGWAGYVVPWGFVAALGIFVGEEVLGWVGSRR